MWSRCFVLCILVIKIAEVSSLHRFRHRGGLVTVFRAFDKHRLLFESPDQLAAFDFSASGRLVNCMVQRNRFEFSLRNHSDLDRPPKATPLSLRRANISKDIALGILNIQDLMRRCSSIKAFRRKHLHRRYRRFDSMRHLLIFPGTKWCGKGNIASFRYDFGREIEADFCCFMHDSCDSNIPSGKSRFGLRNQSPFTINSCSCDERFRGCLEDAKTATADEIGRLYFNHLQVQCYKPLAESVCLKHVFLFFCSRRETKIVPRMFHQPLWKS